MLYTLPSRLHVLIERYAVESQDGKKYVMRAVNEREAEQISTCLRLDAEKVNSQYFLYSLLANLFKTTTYLAKNIHLHFDLAQDYSITQRDPLQLYRSMPSHLPELAFDQIESFSVCEPYLWRYTDLTAKPPREHNYLRRWTINLRRRFSLLQQRYLWATDAALDGGNTLWEFFETPASSASSTAVTPIPSHVARESQWMLQDEILPEIQKTLKIFNNTEVGGKLTADMMWFLQDDMKFWTWMGADENGDDIQEWDMYDGIAYVNRGREEAARCYRSATRKGAEGLWKKCKKW
ncbi:hypothetical protein CBER1_07186 [Cercospora berteroae]|uniref:Uncharacterized protein n=1 Tax=Cercospora berteroae TaxID=357750 RepID=A0A2S6BS16_9PEZI|nr:hypothetical protein CBER1_07186 [Cercospora berteroae]